MSFCRRLLQVQGATPALKAGGLWSQAVRGKKGYSLEKKIKLAKEKADMTWLEPLQEYKAEKAQEPPKEPHKLHVVWRVKSTSGRPWWEKEIIKKYGLDEKKGSMPVVVKNTPTDNQRLREVKHLLKIRPLTLPQGFPENEADIQHCTIKSNGEMVFVKKIQSLEANTGPVEGKDPKWALTKETVDIELDYKKKMFEVHTEYFPTTYTYKRNQDGKEYRYNFSKERVLK